MSSPNNNNNGESDAGETNISLEDEGVLDFEVDASEIQKNDDTNAKSGMSSDKKDDVAEPSACDEEKNDDDGELEDGEDGEVTDSDDEETVKVAVQEEEPSTKSRDEKAPICRFFSRGQCTWGNQCRFVHPGGMGRGPSPFSHQGRPYGGAPAPYPPPGAPYSSVPMAPVENAWERGLRNAKQLLKEANRRREEDPAFEDRRLHQGLQESPPREVSLRPSPSPSPPLRSKLYGTFDKSRDGRPRQPSVGRAVAPPIKMNLLDKSKKLPTKRPFSASPSRSPSQSPKKVRVSPSPPPPRSVAPVEVKKKTEKKSDAAKREELMKQLKAVEDAIAKKKARA
ncbi:zinc finger CCCH domain-containing protein 18 [Galendromus occidentalis]|uniref:Zinc finger CCCH domain-containing protein 18 n=1 Tax=Galendromus occidentalis TaxID=34638 RepID=A0AAJ7L3X5_9ACAR|nr:zinc finger CCCH domain-containing protein 18 [Galendromus occidentalis]